MSEGSIPWDDGGGGDGDPAASLFSSPYQSSEWQDLYSKLFLGDSTLGYVMPAFDNDLAVTEKGAPDMSIDVDTGAAMVNGVLYRNNASLNIAVTAADGSNPRIDRVILRVTRGGTQTVRLAILDGTPGASPALPSLTQTSGTYEVDIAHIYVQTSAASITDEDISDKRTFAPNFRSTDRLLGENLTINSEFYAFSALQGGATTNPPDYYELVATPSDIANATKPSQMARGRAIQITADASDEGVSQVIDVIASTHYVIKLLINVTSGDVGKIIVTTDSAGPATVTREIRRVGTWLEETIHYDTEGDATQLTIQLLAANSADIVKYGQVLVAKGHFPGEFRQIHETIPFVWQQIEDASWDFTAKGLANYTLDLSSDFGTLVPLGCRGLIVILAGWNSNGGKQTFMTLGRDGASQVLGIKCITQAGSSTQMAVTGEVPLVNGTTFDVRVANSGFTVAIRIVGVIT